MALDRRLGDVYEILSKNPQGCFTNSKGDTLPASEATQKLDKRAQRLGELIDRENELLKRRDKRTLKVGVSLIISVRGVGVVPLS